MPAATLRMKAARSKSRCEGTSASAGSSRSVRAKSLDARMGGKDTGGLAPAGSLGVFDRGDHLLPEIGPGPADTVVEGIGTVRGHLRGSHGIPRDRGVVTPPLDAGSELVPPDTRLDAHR